MSAPAFMTDPEQLRSLEGQQYLVLRPGGGVSELFSQTQRRVRGLMPAGSPHPNAGHVTLRGFWEPGRVAALRESIRGWAAAVAAIEVAVDRVDSFPAPFQVAILRLARTSSVVGACAGLTEHLGETDFARIGELPLDEWVFHMSLAYGSAVPSREWLEVASGLADLAVERPAVVVGELEFVWYDGGEHREVIPLGPTVSE
ncbi:2'-5' RNA ligase family protein [Agromyces sp. NPDC058110]|uniref:2'-5' RNA ligase family protein n=1 Tax=Agromyces sp. NPDC058110 TaxID=3346345 RepID=UPI0036D90F32